MRSLAALLRQLSDKTPGKLTNRAGPADPIQLFDARIWQDVRFRDHPAALWAASLLGGQRLADEGGGGSDRIALVDPAMPALAESIAALFKAQQPLATSSTSRHAVIVRPLPTRYSPYPLSKLSADQAIPSIALVDDTLPLSKEAITGLSPETLAALQDADAFFVRSADAARWLVTAFDVQPQRIAIGGCPVPPSIIGRTRAGPDPNIYFLVVIEEAGGLDLELPLIAHALCDIAQRRHVRLLVIGDYHDHERIASLQLVRDCGGSHSLITFRPRPQNEALAALYSGALATICPTRRGGFPMSAVGANVNRSPVFVSDVPAHAYLGLAAHYRFRNGEHRRLAAEMARFIISPLDTAKAALREQGEFWLPFRMEAVGQRLRTFALDTARLQSTLVPPAAVVAPIPLRRPKPRLAILSPVPPDPSGIAAFTAVTMAAVSKRAEIDIYTKTKAPVGVPFARAIHPLSDHPYRSGKHDAQIAVVGNSDRHLEIFEMLLEHGGPCIAHDARMVHFYASALGPERTLEVARRELRRDVSWYEVEVWLRDQRELPTIFLSEVAAAASPLFVHSDVSRRLISESYHCDAKLLPFVVYRTALEEFQGRGAQMHARLLLGIDAGVPLIVTLGDVTEDKGLAKCIEAIEVLAASATPVHLVIVGRPHPTFTPFLKQITRKLELERLVRFTDAAVLEREYQAYLAAADGAIQLRSYDFGALSGALQDCMAAGLPTVASRSLTRAMDGVSYVRPAHDELAPAALAEDLRAILNPGDRLVNEEERRAFVAAHHPDAYADRLLEELGFS